MMSIEMVAAILVVLLILVFAIVSAYVLFNFPLLLSPLA